MAFILTFLGKGGTGKTTLAIAAAKKLAHQGKRVLLVSQDPSPALGLTLGIPLSTQPQDLAPNLKGVQLQSATLLEQSWDMVKTLEAQYLRTPFFKAVFGQELGVLPGMDQALALNTLREFDQSQAYDAIVYDGAGGQETLRMLGTPEILSWYTRRFRQVFADSDLGKTLSPFVQPIAGAILNNVNAFSDNFAQPTAEVNDLLDRGKQAVNDPQRVAAYLVTTADPAALTTARYLWGSAQQVGVTVAGVLVTGSLPADENPFQPLAITSVPTFSDQNWQPLIDALPDFTATATAPQAIAIDVANRKVKLFLPGFDKQQVKLTQYGPEITIEAGDQRRNIYLPSALRGQPVQGAKFQDGYLIISF